MSLSKLRFEISEAVRRSGQRSYQRRVPAPESTSEFVRIGHELRDYVEKNPQSAEAWRLWSQTEECLLHYREAIGCLENAIALSRADRRDLKRMALLREALSEWEDLGLTPAQLQELGEYLEQCGAAEELNGRTLEHTRKWLELRNIAKAPRIIDSLANRGGRSDFTILHNVVRG